jgi:Ca2+-binding EF-hand superfamily protein
VLKLVLIAFVCTLSALIPLEMQWRMRLLLLVALLGLITFARAQEEDEAEEEADEEDERKPAEDHGTSDDDQEYDLEELTSDQIIDLHKKMDGNGNGQVSLAELLDFTRTARQALAKSEMKAVMHKMDLDADGKVSLKEFMEQAGPRPANLKKELDQERKQEFNEADDNKDGFLDMDELTGIFHHHINDKAEMKLTAIAMTEKDVDKNGVLSLQEFYSHLADTNSEEGEESATPTEPELTDEDRQTFKKLDIDNSGTLTLKELKAWETGTFHSEEAMKKLFKVADKNGDSVLTPNELDESRTELATQEHVEAHSHLEAWAAAHAHGEL